MSVDGFERLDAGHVGSGLARLHEKIVRHRSRIEITRNGCDETCVIITKSELDGLEEALSILADTEGFKTMHTEVSQIALDHGPGLTA